MGELPTVYIGGADDPHGDVWMWACADDGEVLAQHICSHRSYGRLDLHERRRESYIAKFGAFGDGTFYRIVEVHTWSDVPAEVRQRNAARSGQVPAADAVEHEHRKLLG